MLILRVPIYILNILEHVMCMLCFPNNSQKLQGRHGSLLEINRCGEATNENGGGKMKRKGNFHYAVYFS